MQNLKKDFFLLIKTFTLLILLLTFSEIFTLFISKFINLSNLSKEQLSFIFILGDILFMIILFLAYRKTLKEDFKNFCQDFSNNINISFKYWFIGLLIMVISNFFITISTNAIANNEEAVRSLLSALPLYMIFSISLYAPFTEELVFRKGFNDIFKSKWLYILGSGLTFGAFHVISSLESITDLLYLIPYCSLGIAFSSLYYKTKNIFCSISMHFFHNTMTLILLLLSGQVI